jgi:hypothetical protein
LNHLLNNSCAASQEDGAGAFTCQGRISDLARPEPPSQGPVPGKLILVAIFMICVGLIWLASDIKQWRKFGVPCTHREGAAPGISLAAKICGRANVVRADCWPSRARSRKTEMRKPRRDGRRRCMHRLRHAIRQWRRHTGAESEPSRTHSACIHLGSVNISRDGRRQVAFWGGERATLKAKFAESSQ